MGTRLEKMDKKSENKWNQIHLEYVQIRAFMANIDAALNKRLRQTSQPTTEPTLTETDLELVSKFNFPLDNCDQLKEFNDCLLTNPLYRQHLIEKFGKILGTDGLRKGDSAAPILAEILMTPKLLPQTSWTGTSRTVGVTKKVPFQSFESIINLFYEIIQRADTRWTLLDNVNYLKDKLLKHANARSLAHSIKRKNRIERLNATQTPTVTPTENIPIENSLPDCVAQAFKDVMDIKEEISVESEKWF